MTIRNMKKRVNKVAGAPVPASHATTNDALVVLRKASVDLCGEDREQWIARCASDRATPTDRAVLKSLPSDALSAARLSALDYVCLMYGVLQEF